MPTIRAVLTEATDALREAGVESPRLDAEVLLRAALGWDRARLYAGLTDPLDAAVAEAYHALVARRAAGEPVAYLTGEREFMGQPFAVGPGVLVPRPETECLVEWLAARARAEARWRAGLVAVDVGTGSGAIACALALELPQARVVAVERSPDALPYARENRRRLGLERRVALVQGDLLGPVAAADLIAANLPYLRPDQLHAGIGREPVEALVSGADGLDAYRALLPQAGAILRSPGLFAAEIDPSQAEAMVALCRASFPQGMVTVERDLAGLDRFVTVALQ
jgi:release factor glutamine methyltransferase